jgi:hypothetical protein
VILPPPIVISDAPPSEWTSYVTPAATFRDALPVSIVFATTSDDEAALQLSGDALRDVLEVASRAWETPACSAARFSIGSTIARTGNEADNGRNEIVIHTTDWPPPLTTNAAAHTVIRTSGAQILEADIHLNARDFTFALGDVAGRVDLQSILTHELGHVLGIGHSDDDRATMSAGLPAGIAARSLESDDRAAVCALYPGTGSIGCANDACPASYQCVGFTCVRAGEPGMDGAPCAPIEEGRRCAGAGDGVRCIATSVGERCARACATDNDCGVGLSCVTLTGNDRVCLPIGATIESGDAGDADSGPDSRADSAIERERSESEHGCAAAPGASGARPLPPALLLGFLIARRRRTERR